MSNAVTRLFSDSNRDSEDNGSTPPEDKGQQSLFTSKSSHAAAKHVQEATGYSKDEDQNFEKARAKTMEAEHAARLAHANAEKGLRLLKVSEQTSKELETQRARLQLRNEQLEDLKIAYKEAGEADDAFNKAKEEMQQKVQQLEQAKEHASPSLQRDEASNASRQDGDLGDSEVKVAAEARDNAKTRLDAAAKAATLASAALKETRQTKAALMQDREEYSAEVEKLEVKLAKETDVAEQALAVAKQADARKHAKWSQAEDAGRKADAYAAEKRAKVEEVLQEKLSLIAKEEKDTEKGDRETGES